MSVHGVLIRRGHDPRAVREYVRFQVNGLDYQATIHAGQKVVELHRVQGERYRSIPVSDKRFTRITDVLWGLINSNPRVDLYLAAASDYSISDEHGRNYTPEEARRMHDAGLVANCNLAFQRLVCEDFDVEKVKAHFGRGRKS